MDLREKITLDPDPVWTDRYEAERDRIRDVAADGLLGVFHVGSTAIPDLPGKPALDVLAVYGGDESMGAAAEALAEGEYELHHEGEGSALVIRWADDHAAFLKLHTRDDEKVRNQLIFRDFLRETPAARREYERAKRDAVAEHPGDPEAYTKAKSEVVTSLIEQAHEQGYADRLPAFA